MNKIIAMLKIATLIVLVVLSCTLRVNAQVEKTAPQSGGYWLAYIGDNKINSHLGIHSEVQLRSFFVNHNVETFLSRVGLNVYIHPQATATAGYGFIDNRPTSEAVAASHISENRIWQQLLLRQKRQRVFMEHRYRLEQRFLNNHTHNTHSVEHRVRYRFQTLFPVHNIIPDLRYLFVSLNNEVMLNFKSNPARVYDRNRFFAGLGYQLNPNMNLQLGYLNQFANVPSKTRGHVDHLVQLAWIYNTDALMQMLKKDLVK